ncbi:MAG: hypothetical protein WBC07_09400 [Methylotenera sp.]
MFDDLGEQQHVFSLLDEWANDHTDSALTYQTGSKSNFFIELTKLMTEVQKLEAETIKINPKLKIGFSFQSDLLRELSSLLEDANTTAKLLDRLSNIKILLLQAMIIGIEIKYGKLELINAIIKPDAEIGKSRKIQIKEWSKKGSETVKKYSDEDKNNWLEEAKKLRLTNKNLSFRTIASKINKSNSSKPSVETVRKHIANKLG